MKKIVFPFSNSFIGVAMLMMIFIISCHKPSIDRFYPDRMFTPTSITITGGDTAVWISWPASLNTNAGTLTYTVEISKDSTFKATPEMVILVDSIAVRVTDDSLQDRQPYFARVRANQNGTSAASNWMTDTVRFTFVGVQIFKPIPGTDIIDNAAILHWTPTPGVSMITLSASGADTIKLPISADDNLAGMIMATGLKAGKAYTAEIFVGDKSKGLLTFTTKVAQSGANIVDLRSSNDANVLYDTLPNLSAGSIVLLARGMTYDMPTYIINKTVTIMSGLGFDSPAVLALSGNFDASGNIDSIRFSDINFKANGATYFMNVSQQTNITKMSIVNCTTSGVFNNSFIRLKTANDVIGHLYIDNCVIDSFGIAAKYAVLYASASNSAVINNIEIHNSTFSDIMYFIRQDGVAGVALTIDNCTFDNYINQAGYFVNYSGTNPPLFTISNCILGKTLDPASSNGIKSSANAVFSNTYATSDAIFSANPFIGAISYAGTADNLFVDPANGNFSIKDNSFAGRSSAGDPRWRN